eukprot:482804_1
MAAVLFCLSSNGILLESLIVMIICAFILIILVPIAIYQIYSTNSPCSFRTLYIANCLLFLSGSIGYAAQHYMSQRDICITYMEWIISGWFAYWGYYTGLNALYWILLFRIKLMFPDLSTTIYYLILLLIFINCLLVIVTGVIYTLSRDSLDENANKILLLSMTISVFIISFIAILFIKKTYILYRNIIIHTNAKTPQIEDNQSNYKLKQVLLGAAIKYSICSSIALSTTLVAILWTVYRSYIVETDTLSNWCIHSMIGNLDMLMNFLCLAIQHQSNQPIYDKLCGYCHSKLLFMKSKKKKTYIRADKQRKQRTGLMEEPTGNTIELQTNVNSYTELQIMKRLNEELVKVDWNELVSLTSDELDEFITTTLKMNAAERLRFHEMLIDYKNQNQKMETTNNTLIAQANNKWVEDDQVIFNKVTMDSSTKKSKKDTSSAAKSVTGTTTTTTSDIDFSSRLYT